MAFDFAVLQAVFPANMEYQVLLHGIGAAAKLAFEFVVVVVGSSLCLFYNHVIESQHVVVQDKLVDERRLEMVRVIAVVQIFNFKEQVFGLYSHGLVQESI
jgi:hypothetical protein